MASRKRSSSSSMRRRSDRISNLTDDVLGHVLSFLSTKEAARAAALARRWRHAFGSVHTISFEEAEGERERDWVTYYYDSEERKSCSDALLDGINAALLCRRRCPGQAVPLRSLRFAFDSWHWWDRVAVDQWLAYALPPPPRRRHCNASHTELHLDLRFCIGSICGDSIGNRRGGADDDSDSDEDENETRWRYLLPRRLLSCAAIRTLCLSHCRLKLPGVPIDLPFLETLRLTGLHHDSGRSIQRLISSCPRLTHLTLEAMFKLKRVSVVDKRLHHFALRCCHNVKSVDIDMSELRSLEYKGWFPPGPLFSLHGSPPAIITSCTIDLCQGLSSAKEFPRFTRFLEKISGVKHLHLHHGKLRSKFFFETGFPLFSSMTHLTLQGCIKSWDTVVVVRMLLEQTPNLEVLALLMELKDSKDKDDDRGGAVSRTSVHDESSFSIPCLKHRLREIAIQDYDGSKAEKMLVKLLLRNSLVLERLHVLFREGLRSKEKNRHEVQMGKWGVANSEKIFTS